MIFKVSERNVMIFKVSERNFNVWRIFAHERRMSVAKTETGLLPNRFANLCEKWIMNIMSPTNTHMYAGNTNCSHILL